MKIIKIYSRLLSKEVELIVDDEDFQRLIEFNWQHDGDCKGSVRRRYYSNYRLYRVSLASEILRQPEIMYDHKDGNPFNNQKHNLRECDKSSNAINTGKKKGNYTSKYKGVYAAKGRWAAQLGWNNKKVYLGYHESPEEAASVYNKAALEYFGEFAVLNKDEEGNVL